MTAIDPLLPFSVLRLFFGVGSIASIAGADSATLAMLDRPQ
jgi:hypothetical protein